MDDVIAQDGEEGEMSNERRVSKGRRIYKRLTDKWPCD